MRQLLLGAALAATLGAAALPAAAQTYGAAQPARARNQALLDAAVEAYGFDPARLSSAQGRALADAWARLLPDESERTYRLNRTQALAIAYVALVLRQQPGGRGDDGWDRGPGRDPWDGPGRGGDRGAVAEAERVLLELASSLPAPTLGNGLYLDPEERERVRADAQQIGRLALEGRCSALAAEASRLASAAAGNGLVERRPVAAALERMKETAAACR